MIELNPSPQPLFTLDRFPASPEPRATESEWDFYEENPGATRLDWIEHKELMEENRYDEMDDR